MYQSFIQEQISILYQSSGLKTIQPKTN